MWEEQVGKWMPGSNQQCLPPIPNHTHCVRGALIQLSEDSFISEFLKEETFQCSQFSLIKNFDLFHFHFSLRLIFPIFNNDAFIPNV